MASSTRGASFGVVRDVKGNRKTTTQYLAMTQMVGGTGGYTGQPVSDCSSGILFLDTGVADVYTSHCGPQSLIFATIRNVGVAEEQVLFTDVIESGHFRISSTESAPGAPVEVQWLLINP